MKNKIVSKKIIFFILYFSPLLWRGAGGEAFSQSQEVKLLSTIYNDSSSHKVAVAKIFSGSVAPISAVVPAAILITGIIKKDSALIEKGIKASVSFALTAVISTGMKYNIDRSRPFVIYPSLFHAKANV